MKLSELSIFHQSGLTFQEYDSSNNAAYRTLLELEPYLKKYKKISVTTLRHFLENVFLSGDNNIDLKEFVKFLRNKGIVVKRRKKLYK